MRWIKLVCIAGVGSTSACFYEPDPITVTLEFSDEDFRDLPAIASGRTSLLGQSVPDSHGEVTALVHVANTDRVEFDELTAFTVQVNDAPLDLEVERVRVNDADAPNGNPLTPVTMSEGDLVIINFSAKQLAEIVQPQGADYVASAEVSWSEADAFGGQTGTAPLEVPAIIAATVNAGSFALVGDRPQEAIPPASLGAPAQMKASVEITSGLAVDVSAARVKITFIGLGDAVLPVLGLALIDQPALQIADVAAAQVTPSDILDIYTSTTPTAPAAPNEPAGTAATTGDVAGGKALVTIEIDYTPTDGTAGLTTDALAYVVDVP
ncbi:MAG: hypothetical protein Q8O67_32225 [Deltaproteobacteria bacterium]|nr:hypothetical protein [Deltaproteobacteria bacterium]